jgi:hypothetical protein
VRSVWFPALRLPLGFARGFGENRAGSCAKDAQRLVHPADYGAVRTPCVAGGGVDKHGVLRLHFVIGFANNKVPLRMTGLKRVPISQHADGSGERQSPLCDQCSFPPLRLRSGQALAQRTRKNEAPSALVVQAGKASGRRATSDLKKFSRC